MIKMMRNLLGDYKIICHEDDDCLEKIEWQYIEQLNAVQEDLGFSLANKLKKKHILWQKHKMKVSIAVQTLSTSVAYAPDFLRVDMAVEAYAGSKPTSDSIKKVDELFDFLNSRNPFAHGNKAPVSLQNLHIFSEKCDAIAKYIFALKNEKGNFLRTGQKKTVIWGFVFSVQSIMAIFAELPICSYKPYKYIMTYRFSQDHLELLFNKIHGHCGWNIIQMCYSSSML